MQNLSIRRFLTGRTGGRFDIMGAISSVTEVGEGTVLIATDAWLFCEREEYDEIY